MAEKYLGITDVPCTNKNDIKMGVEKYIVGLESFVQNCHTPMSIALQGDWGTGKTSFLNAMENDLKEVEGIKTVYFNTWQYSQFQMSESLYVSFLNSIIDKLTDKKSEAYDIVKKLVKSVTGTLFSQALKKVTTLDLEKIEQDVFSKEEAKMQGIAGLKSAFANLVEDVTKTKKNEEHGRLIIFVDDLDRLNPEIAVELLEVMKLFMDVPHCIFVLAIDYDVVVTGVRKKFGSQMSEEKCRSFFDKIIQLPFHMPIGSYQIDSMMKEIFKDSITKEHIEPISTLVKDTLGANPRTLKRMANSYFLLMTVREHTGDKLNAEEKKRYSTLVLISLIIQMHCPDLYNRLVECDDTDAIAALLDSVSDLGSPEGKQFYMENNDIQEMNEHSWYKFQQTIHATVKTLNAIVTDGADIFEQFLNALSLSSITHVVEGKNQNEKGRNAAMKVNKIILYGEETPVKNPTEALLKTYYTILRKNEDRILKFMEAYPRIMTFDSTRKDAFFRAPKPLHIDVEGHGQLIIGTSNSSDDKLQFTGFLCKFMEVAPGSVIWKNEDAEIYKY